MNKLYNFVQSIFKNNNKDKEIKTEKMTPSEYLTRLYLEEKKMAATKDTIQLAESQRLADEVRRQANARKQAKANAKLQEDYNNTTGTISTGLSAQSLSNWDTSNMTNMSTMFSSGGPTLGSSTYTMGGSTSYSMTNMTVMQYKYTEGTEVYNKSNPLESGTVQDIVYSMRDRQARYLVQFGTEVPRLYTEEELEIKN